MQSLSRTVHSSQRGVHSGLPALLQRHQAYPWQKPEQQVDLPALKELDHLLDGHEGPVILDSFCGTGQSTSIIAKRHEEALVIGVDKSKHRLERRSDAPSNSVFLQAHCEAVWRHLEWRQQRLLAHYILYPNPWPKPGHLSRRVHGHPAFPLLVKLGGKLELRSNWQTYVEEFGVSLHLLGYVSRIALVPADAQALTLFEEKYRNSGQDLWTLHAALPG